eukprot:EG_transcript_36004
MGGLDQYQVWARSKKSLFAVPVAMTVTGRIPITVPFPWEVLPRALQACNIGGTDFAGIFSFARRAFLSPQKRLKAEVCPKAHNSQQTWFKVWTGPNEIWVTLVLY